MTLSKAKGTYDLVSQIEPESLRHSLVEMIVNSLFETETTGVISLDWKTSDLSVVEETLKKRGSVDATIAWHAGRGDHISVARAAIQGSVDCFDFSKLRFLLLTAQNALSLMPDPAEIVVNHSVYNRPVLTLMAAIAHARFLVESHNVLENEQDTRLTTLTKTVINQIPSSDRFAGEMGLLRLSACKEDEESASDIDWLGVTRKLVKRLLGMGNAIAALDLLQSASGVDTDRGVIETLSDGWDDLIVYLVVNHCSPSLGWVRLYYKVSKCVTAPSASEDVLRRILSGKILGKLHCQIAYRIAFLAYATWSSPILRCDEIPNWIFDDFAALGLDLTFAPAVLARELRQLGELADPSGRRPEL
jgi:hypothetical protein